MDEDYGMEMVEHEDFAQDGDFHNMYPHPDGFSTNDPEPPGDDEHYPSDRCEAEWSDRLQDIIDNPDPVNEWESEAFFQGY